MELRFLENDGRCRWFNKTFLQELIPLMQLKNKKLCFIKDWFSNDNGRVGLDLEWLKSLNINIVETYNDIPDSTYTVVNSGYDSIINEEKFLKEKGINIIDKPCPFVRKLRNYLENADSNYQYILLCEKNHIIIKNFKSIFPKDLILVQMNNYEEYILKNENGKPFCLLPYVTFLPVQVETIFSFIEKNFKNRNNKLLNTSCMWVSSKFSPIVEINSIPSEEIKKIKEAIIITTPDSMNKSVASLITTCKNRGLNVELISSLDEYISYEEKHKNDFILFIRSPIPNNAEEPI
ncbi:TPA: LytB, partial [Clostridium perfringens]|nr:LytB [Clostridium perfringens]